MSEIFEREPEYGNSVGRVNNTGYNGTQWVEVRIDGSTRATTTIEYEHHEIHGGSYYTVSLDTNIAATAELVVLIVTGNTTKELHILTETVAERETHSELLEGVTASSTGHSLTAYNHNRVSTNTSTAAFVTASVTNYGTSLTQWHVGSGKSGGADRASNEWVLKTSTNYALYAYNENTSAGWLVIKFRYYEHTPKAQGD